MLRSRECEISIGTLRTPVTDVPPPPPPCPPSLLPPCALALADRMQYCGMEPFLLCTAGSSRSSGFAFSHVSAPTLGLENEEEEETEEEEDALAILASTNVSHKDDEASLRLIMPLSCTRHTSARPQGVPGRLRIARGQPSPTRKAPRAQSLAVRTSLAS